MPISYFFLSRIFCYFLMAYVLLVVVPSNAQTPDVVVAPDTMQGVNLFQAGDTNGAIAKLLSAVKANEKDAEAWHFLGRCYNRIGKAGEALQAFATAVKLRPAYVPSRAGLAATYQRLNKLSEAQHEAEAALKIESKCEDCHYVLSLIATNKGEHFKAWRAAATALEINPGLTVARDIRNQALVNIYAQVIDPRLKLEELETKDKLVKINTIAAQYGIMLDPNMATEDFRRKQEDRFKYALDCYEKALVQAPQDPDAVEWRERLESLRAWKTFVLSGEDAFQKQLIYHRKDLSSDAVPHPSPKYNYPDEFRNAGIKGRVVLYTVVDETGHVQSILILHSLHPYLTQQALNTARQQAFDPAMRGGKPVKCLVVLRYAFGM
jgi:TonB family protein